jgi:membrane-anchored protein YejM (alkaline phosphatase superfamily)
MKLFSNIKPNLKWASVFWLLNAFLLTAISFRFWQWLSIPRGDLRSVIYLLTTQYGLFGAFCVLALALHVLLSWLPVRLFKVLGVIAAFALATLLVCDTLVFAQYRFHINGVVLQMLFEGGVIDLSWYTWLVGGFIGLVLLTVESLFSILAHETRRASRLRKPAYMIMALCVLVSQGMHIWDDANYRTQIPSYSREFPLYYPLTAKTRLMAWGLVNPSVALKKENNLHLESHGVLNYPLQPISYQKPAQQPNILFILIDAWRYDDANPQVTPNVMNFSQLALRFHQHRSGGNSTEPGIFTLFYSLPDTYWLAARNSGQRPVLMQTLADEGYEFAIHGSANLNTPPFDRTVFAHIPNLVIHNSAQSPALRDQQITDEFTHFIDTRDAKRPFFGYLFYDAAHGYDLLDGAPTPFKPYWHRVDHIKLNNDFDPTAYHNLYRNALHYDDSLISQVLAKLAQAGLDKNTLVIITSDHGEEFNDHKMNYWGHGSNYSDVQIHVPMFMRLPDGTNGDINRRTNHFDVVPTLMQLALGVKTPAHDYSVGQSLLDPNTPHPDDMIVGSYYNYAVVSPDLISVVYPGGLFETLTPDLKPSKLLLHGDRLKSMIDLMSRFNK